MALNDSDFPKLLELLDRIDIRVKVRRRTKAEWEALNEVLLNGEWGLETDTRRLKLGNGAAPWQEMPYVETAFLLAGLGDVDLSSRADGTVLSWDATEGKYTHIVPAAGGGGGGPPTSDPYAAAVTSELMFSDYPTTHSLTNFTCRKGKAFTATSTTVNQPDPYARYANTSSGGYVRSTDSGLLDFGTGDFTIEMLMDAITSGFWGRILTTRDYPNPGGFHILSVASNGADRIDFHDSNGVTLSRFGKLAGWPSPESIPGHWRNLTVTRKNGVFRGFFDGHLVGTGKPPGTYDFTAPGVSMGANFVGGEKFSANIYGWRFTAACRYTEDYLPPMVF